MNREEYFRLKYPIRIIEDETGGWFVQIPDLPGCMTVVERFEDAHEEIERVKEVWIEFALEDGQEIPLPSTEKEYSGRFSLRIPRSLHERLAKQAAEEGMSLNNYCTYLLSLGCGRHDSGRVGQDAKERPAGGRSQLIDGAGKVIAYSDRQDR